MCRFDSQILTLVVSSLYLAAGFVAPVAGKLADMRGRKVRERQRSFVVLLATIYSHSVEYGVFLQHSIAKFHSMLVSDERPDHSKA